jgi:MFS family permease
MRNVWNLIARNRDYRLLLGANLTSQLGDWMLGTGLMFYIYASTGSVLASGVMLFAALVPQLFLGSLAGVLVDRWDRRRTMIIANVLLALTVIPLFAMHDMHDASQIWLVYLVVFVQAVLEQFFTPAEAAMVPQVVPDEDLVAANALNGQNRQIARLAGAAAGGVLAAAGGIVLLSVVDLVSYVVAAALVVLVRSRPSPVRAEGSAENTAETDGAAKPAGLRSAWTRFQREWRAGVGLCFGRRDLTTLFVFRLMNGFGEGVLTVLLTPLIIGVLHANSTEYGSVLSVQAIGGIAGGLAIAAIGRQTRPRLLLGYGAFTFGVLNLVIAFYPLALPKVWPIFFLVILLGIPLAAQNAGFTTLQQMHTPDEYRGRIFGTISTGWATSYLLGIVVASTLGDVVGIIAVISLQGFVHVIAGPFVLARIDSAPAMAAVPAAAAVETGP